MISKSNPLFQIIDIPTIRTSKITQVEPYRLKDNILYLYADDVSVRVEKLEHQSLSIKCTCPYCGKKGIATHTLCRRKIAVVFWLLKKGGRISEIEIKPKKG